MNINTLTKASASVVFLFMMLIAFDNYNNYENNQVTGLLFGFSGQEPLQTTTVQIDSKEVPETIEVNVEPGWNIIAIPALYGLISSTCGNEQISNIIYAYYPQANEYGRFLLSEDFRSILSSGDSKSDGLRNSYPETLEANHAVWLFNFGEQCTFTSEKPKNAKSFALPDGWKMVAVQPNWAGKRLGSIIGSCNAELGFTYSQPAGWRLMTEEDVFSSKDVGKGFWMDSSTCFFNGFSEDKIIKSCGDVKERGSYFLSGDLVLEPKVYDSNTACLNIRDTNEVFIDCEDRSITGPVAVRIENLKGFSLSFCRLESSSQVPSIRRILEVVNSENGVLRRSVIGSDYDAYNDVIKSSNITIVNNLFHSSVQQAYSINNIIRQNTFNPTQWGGAAVIISNMGFNNRIESNNIDGKSDGKFENRLGFDDGIGFQDEEKTSIINNVIKNVWDCGIETVGTISQAEISGNVIENAGLCGIGGWYWNSWKENLISDNIVSDSPYMLYIFRSYGLRPEDKFFYFRGNIFSGNKFNNQRASSQSSVIQITKKAGKSSSEGEREIRDEDIIAGNNVFSDNNFGTVTPAPEFTPTEMIVDGGGNICAEVPPYRQPYPLNCDKE